MYIPGHFLINSFHRKTLSKRPYPSMTLINNIWQRNSVYEIHDIQPEMRFHIYKKRGVSTPAPPQFGLEQCDEIGFRYTSKWICDVWPMAIIQILSSNPNFYPDFAYNHKIFWWVKCLPDWSWYSFPEGSKHRNIGDLPMNTIDKAK